MTAPRAIVDGRVGAHERLAQLGSERIVWILAIAWIWFVITGLRMPWQPIVVTDENGGGGTRQLFFTACAGLSIFRMVASRSLNQAFGHQLGPLILGLFMFGSVSYSSDPVLTVKRSIVYLFGFSVLLGVTQTVKRPLDTYLRALVYTTGAAAIISILANFGLPKNCTTIEMRPGLAGVTVHPNVFGPCLQIAFLLSLGMTPRSARDRKFLYLCRGAIFLALLMSNSMTATLATFVGIGVFIMLTTKSYTAGLLQVFGVLCVGCISLIGPDELKSMFFSASGRDESMSGRDVLWGAVFNEGMKNPLFGSGYGSFWYEGRGREITGTWNPRQSHNAYLDVFVDLGVVGALFVMCMFHKRYILAWIMHVGPRGSASRRALAGVVTMAASLCYIGAFGESFLLKLDKYQFVAFLWGGLVLGNNDANGLKREFAQLDAEFPQIEKREIRTRLGRLHVEPPETAKQPNGTGPPTGSHAA